MLLKETLLTLLRQSNDEKQCNQARCPNCDSSEGCNEWKKCQENYFFNSAALASFTRIHFELHILLAHGKTLSSVILVLYILDGMQPYKHSQVNPMEWVQLRMNLGFFYWVSFLQILLDYSGGFQKTPLNLAPKTIAKDHKENMKQLSTNGQEVAQRVKTD